MIGEATTTEEAMTAEEGMIEGAIIKVSAGSKLATIAPAATITDTKVAAAAVVTTKAIKHRLTSNSKDTKHSRINRVEGTRTNTTTATAGAEVGAGGTGAGASLVDMLEQLAITAVQGG